MKRKESPKKRLNLREFEQTLRKHRIGMFASADLRRLFGLSQTAVRFLLHRYSARGITVRLKRDLYALAETSLPEAGIANRLFEPSYVSLESALSHHRIILETVYAVTSVTTRKTRSFEAMDRSFSYHHVQPSAFAGYVPVRLGEHTVLIAEPEKALVDYHYFVLRGSRAPFDAERARLEDIDVAKVRTYASLFNDERLLPLLKASFAKKNITL